MINILLVDDDANMEKAVSLFLERAGLENTVVRASSHKEADSIMKSGKFDVHIVDHRLPDGTGLSWLKKKLSCRPFVYATFYLDDELRQEVLAMGGTPFDKNEMIEHPVQLSQKVKAILAA